MENKRILAILILFINSILCSFAQTDSAAKEAIKMRNNIDVYLQQNLGNKPITIKEKLMSFKIDSLIQLTQRQSNLIKTLESPQKAQIEAKSSKQVYTIYFASNSTQISNDGVSLIKELITQHPNSYFTIKGFADAYGVPQYNLSLSMKRASMVRSKLKELAPHINMEIVAAELNSNAINSNAPQNRKVEIILY